MKIQNLILSALLALTGSQLAHAHANLTEDLHTISATATDIIRFQCPNQSTITQAEAIIRDYTPVNAPAVNMTVKIAAASGTTCPAATSAAWNTYAGSTTTGIEGAWSATYTGFMPIAPLAYYCLKVTKNASAKDDYQVEHHCRPPLNANGTRPTHLGSTGKTMIQDQ